MDYLFNYRYKLLNQLQVHITAALASKECGNSEKFHNSLTKIRLWTKHFSTLSSSPFEKSEISLLEELAIGVETLLELPEDFSDKGHALLNTNDTLMQKIDPFTFSEESELPVAEITLSLEQVCIQLESLIQCARGLASPIENLEELLHQEFTHLKPFIFHSGNDELLDLYYTYQNIAAFDAMEELEDLLTKAKNTLISFLKHNKALFYKIVEILRDLYEMHEAKLAAEGDGYESFFYAFCSDDTKAYIHALTAHNEALLHQKSIQSIIKNYELAEKERGNNVISKLRGIGFFKQIKHCIDTIKEF